MNIEPSNFDIPWAAWVLLAVVTACLLAAILFSILLVLAPKMAVRLTDEVMSFVPAVADWVQFRSYRTASLKRSRK